MTFIIYMMGMHTLRSFHYLSRIQHAAQTVTANLVNTMHHTTSHHHLPRQVVNAGGVPTEVLKLPATSEPLIQLLVVPGNPGEGL